MRKVLIAASVAALLSGCVSLGPTYVDIHTPFDRAAAERQMKPGANTLTGSAFLRQMGGNVVTCAGSKVQLLPDTAYARERLSVLYGNLEKGYAPRWEQLRGYRKSPSKEIAPGYHEILHTTTCNARGEFSFKNVGDGVWYLITGVVWVTGTVQGGALMQRVELKGGETKEVLLTY